MSTRRDEYDYGLGREAGTRRAVLYGLISNMGMAAKLTQAAKNYHLTVRFFDKAERLLELASKEFPSLVILDWDDCEAECYKVLGAMKASPDFKKTAIVGYVSQSKMMLKGEAEKSGCLRVYLKTEFLRSIGDLVVRYAQ